MKRILILGANGQLGRDCRVAFGRDCEVRGLDIPDVDIADPASVASAVDAFRPDVVVNCAAWTAVDLAESNEEACRRVNADGPANIANALAGSDAILVHISTDYVFDGAKPLFEAYDEDDVPNPRSVYGRTKLAGEEPVLAYPRGAVLRTAWLYGAGGRNFLRTMAGLALKNPDGGMRVVCDQWGSPTWSASLARQIARLVGDFAPGLYHATSQGFCNWHQLAVRFLDLCGLHRQVAAIPTSEYPTPAARPANSILANRNLKRLGLDVMPDWETDVSAFARLVAPEWAGGGQGGAAQ